MLIVNPNATSTTRAGRDLLAHALESRVELVVAHTEHRGHAVEIAETAKRDGIDVIIIHGGDGTVNEVVNGLLGKPSAPKSAERVPAIAVVPGGSANVFARSLGISPDPIEATNQLVDLLGEYRGGGDWRRIGLMDCGERWAVFTAGMGVDGDVVAAVEAQRAEGHTVTAGRYMRVALREMLASVRREPQITVHLPDREPIPGALFAFVSNASPWTYVNTRPVWTNRDTSFDTGLGVFATTTTSFLANLMLLRRMLSKKAEIKGRHLISEDDVDWVRLTSEQPIACQVDGDFLGLRTEMTFRSVPAALAVVAPTLKT